MRVARKKASLARNPRSPKNVSRARRAVEVRPTGSSTTGALIAWCEGRKAVLGLLLALATFAVYAPVLRHPFVNYDDGEYVINNSHVNTGLNWVDVRWALTSIEYANWHPLTWISHATDYQLFGLNAGGHHFTSLLLHTANVLLLFLLLARVTGKTGRSLLVAGLFALHPLNVETVAWVAERKNVLATLFFLLALAAYGWYARKPNVKRYALVALFFVLGLAAKPMVITLPCVLLLLDFWPLGRILKWSTPGEAFPVPQTNFSKLVREKLPWLGLSVASAVITITAQRSSNAMPAAAIWPLTWRLENAIYAYAAYVWSAFFPRGLAAFYPGVALGTWQVWSALVFLLAVSLTVWRLRTGRPYLVTGWLWFLGTLVPVIGLLQVGGQSRADRYLYIPLIGIFVAVVWLLCDVAESKKFDIRWRVATAAAVLAIFCLLTSRQVGYWRSSLDLWSHTSQVTQDNFVAEENLGLSLVELGREDEALPHFENAQRMRPDNPEPALNIGNYLLKQERGQEAIAEFEMAIRAAAVSRVPIDPSKLASAYSGLGVSYAQTGDRADARTSFLEAIRLNPGETEMYNLSLLEMQESVDKLSISVSEHPTAQGYLQLGQLLQQQRKVPDAQAAFERALQLNPKLADAKQALQDIRGSLEAGAQGR